MTKKSMLQKIINKLGKDKLPETDEVKNGTVKWWHEQKGYGFLLPNDGSPDIFVHYTSVKTKNHKPNIKNQVHGLSQIPFLEDGAEIRYILSTSNMKGPTALAVWDSSEEKLIGLEGITKKYKIDLNKVTASIKQEEVIEKVIKKLAGDVVPFPVHRTRPSEDYDEADEVAAGIKSFNKIINDVLEIDDKPETYPEYVANPHQTQPYDKIQNTFESDIDTWIKKYNKFFNCENEMNDLPVQLLSLLIAKARVLSGRHGNDYAEIMNAEGGLIDTEKLVYAKFKEAVERTGAIPPLKDFKSFGQIIRRRTTAILDKRDLPNKSHNESKAARIVNTLLGKIEQHEK